MAMKVHASSTPRIPRGLRSGAESGPSVRLNGYVTHIVRRSVVSDGVWCQVERLGSVAKKERLTTDVLIEYL